MARSQQQQVWLQRAEGDLQPVPEALGQVLQANRLGAGREQQLPQVAHGIQLQFGRTPRPSATDKCAARDTAVSSHSGAPSLVRAASEARIVVWFSVCMPSLCMPEVVATRVAWDMWCRRWRPADWQASIPVACVPDVD
eukprot:scaffold50229_cov18-Tisochrysis_lutea.AAC.6